MLQMVKNHSVWSYFSATQKDLVKEGEFLYKVVKNEKFKDYSFLVFPFAKAYEGYLKQLFLDVDFITHLDYISDHFRLGKHLSPHLVNRLGDRSIYRRISEESSEELAKKIWEMWKKGRNQIFHYYPHNLRRIEYEEAFEFNRSFLRVMMEAYDGLYIKTDN